MPRAPLSPTNDFVFKKIFSENIAILEHFLKAVLDLPPQDYQGLTVVDPNLERDFIEDKLGVLDIKIHTSSGKIINCEVQVKPQRSIWKRMTFYTSKMVVEQVKSGAPYERINRVISILITDFVLVRENKAYHHCFRLQDTKTGAQFPDSIEVNTLELPKLTESDGTPLSNWLRFFRARTEEDFMTVAQTDPAINEAWGVIKVLSGDERARALAAAREKAHLDFISQLDDARHDGIEEGRQEVTRNLLRKKMPYDDISEVTGLPLDDIQRLAAQLDS